MENPLHEAAKRGGNLKAAIIITVYLVSCSCLQSLDSNVMKKMETTEFFLCLKTQLFIYGTFLLKKHP